MEVKDLKEGEIYYGICFENEYIFVSNLNLRLKQHIAVKGHVLLHRGDFNNTVSNLRPATEEEKHWLNKCIELNKFVSKEEAMKDFKQELTELPEKWAIKITKENVDVIDKHRGVKSTVGFFCTYKPLGNSNWGYNFQTLPEYCTEITFDQFKKWVLKEDVETIPEYVECTFELLSSAKKGKIYQTDKEGFIIDDDGKHLYTWNGGGFKPSTKEAYDLQNNPKFEIGKWYKYNGWYLKFNNIQINIFIASEQIDPKGNYTNIDGFRAGDTNSEKILLTDLSEIQKYLPEGHPDKFISNSLNEEKLLEEAKKRYPIGTKFRAITEKDGLGSIYFQKQECKIFKYNGKFWIIGSANIRNPDGEWAEIIELPKEDKTIWNPKFKVGDKFISCLNLITITEIGVDPIKAYRFDDLKGFDTEYYVSSLTKAGDLYIPFNYHKEDNQNEDLKLSFPVKPPKQQVRITIEQNINKPIVVNLIPFKVKQVDRIVLNNYQLTI